jgi:hypothetical protein
MSGLLVPTTARVTRAAMASGRQVGAASPPNGVAKRRRPAAVEELIRQREERQRG